LSEEALADAGLFDVANIRAVWQAHLSGARNHQYLLWPVLMFQTWRTAQGAPATNRAAESVR
jgi:asparagine synthase (glutamine-hydrolysing)